MLFGLWCPSHDGVHRQRPLSVFWGGHMNQLIRKLVPFILVILVAGNAYARHSIFWLDSYDPTNEWTANLGKAIETTLQGHEVNLKIYHMDTKRNKSESYKKKAAKIAVEKIKEYHPNVVIASEDDASKYVVEPFFKNAGIPFVFCGVNNSATRYGYPYKNATGIVEIDPIRKLIYSLKMVYSLSRVHPVENVGYLAEDSTSAHINAAFFQKQVHLNFVQYYAQTSKDWQKYYKKAQNEVDLLIIGNTSAIKNWNEKAAIASVFTDTKIPSGSVLEFLAPLSFISCIKLPSEQGNWAATTALKIMDGTPIRDIPIAEPVGGKLIINLKIADVLGIKVPKSYVKKADKVIK
jgi:ABC-type uncharacterized transport system substrate-binding protein